MNQSLVTCCNNLFSSSNVTSSTQQHGGCYSRRSHNDGGPDASGGASACLPTPSSCDHRTAAVIVSPSTGGSQQYPAAAAGDISSPFDAAAFCSSSPYVTSAASGHGSYFGAENVAISSPMLHAQNFLPPYCALSPSLSDFNMLHMCYQPLFSEIASPGSESSPAAEPLYGFANRLHPIAATGAHHQFSMPQSYPQTRNGYLAGVVSRPASAAGKRGGRRPKEYEDYDHVALSEEERDKRDKRRLRNKEAAARCRQRRLDLMGSLQNQVEQLKEENKIKDSKIAELQRLKNELLAIVREHQCVLPDSLRVVDVELQARVYAAGSRGTCGVPQPDAPATQPQPTSSSQHFPSPQQALVSGRKRPGIEIPDLRPQAPHSGVHSGVLGANLTNVPAPVHIKEEPDPTLFDVNNRDNDDEDLKRLKRPGSLFFADAGAPVTSYSTVSSSGVPITTPSNLGSGEFGGGISLLDAPTGLTPCHPPQPTPFPSTPLSGDGRTIETL